MLEAKKTNEGIVTSLSDSDLVMAANAQGKFQPISVADLMKVVRPSIQMSTRNLVRKTIYSSQAIEGARFTNGVRLSPDSTGATRFAFVNINKADAGSYAYSFWAKSDNGESTLRIDISDSPQDSMSVVTEWKFYSGVVETSHYGRYYGFIDFNGSSDIIISDLTVVKGNIPLQQWSPAPEDLSGG